MNKGSIVRVKRMPCPYVQVDRCVAKSRDISLSAKGLFFMIEESGGMDDRWFTDEEKAAYAELEAAGLTRQQIDDAIDKRTEGK
jgi:hypothetical protein